MPDPTQTPRAQAARYRSNLRGELDSAALYRALSESEANPQMREVYRRLAAIEEKHAAFWRGHLTQLGASAEPYREGYRTRMLAWLARHFGAALVLPVITTLEQSDSAVYDNQPE